MTYFVQGPDKQTYGPVGIAELTEWAAQGRLTRETLLSEADGARVVRAGSLQGLDPHWPVPGDPCPNCRRPVPVGQAFCANCGAAQAKSPVWPPPPAGMVLPAVPARGGLMTKSPKLDFFLGCLTGWVWEGVLGGVLPNALQTALGPQTADGPVILAWMAALVGPTVGALALRRRYPSYAWGLALSLPVGMVTAVVIYICFLLGAFMICLISGMGR